MEEKEKIDFEKMSLGEIEELDLYKLTDKELTEISNICNKPNYIRDHFLRSEISLCMSIHKISRGYRTPLKQEITELKQENNELKKEIKELKSQNQTLQNNFDLLLRILSQQNPELKDQFQGLFGASNDIVVGKDKSKGQRYTFK